MVSLGPTAPRPSCCTAQSSQQIVNPRRDFQHVPFIAVEDVQEKRFPGVAILANDVVGTRDAVGERRRVEDGLSKLAQGASDLVRDLVLVARGFRLVVNAKDGGGGVGFFTR